MFALIRENILTQINSNTVKTEPVTLGEFTKEVDAKALTEELLKKGLRPKDARYWKSVQNP